MTTRDSHCRHQIAQGGTLFRARNLFTMEEPHEGPTQDIRINLTNRDLDTWCKIAEMVQTMPKEKQNPIWFELGQILRKTYEVIPEAVKIAADTGYDAQNKN